MQTSKQAIFSSIVYLSIIVVIVSAFFWNTDASISSTNITNVAGCTIQNNRCEFIIDQQKFEVTFFQTPLPEEEIRLSITSSTSFTLENAWIEGINMYMGKSPVISEIEEPNTIVAVFFLGSCNLKQMEWRMLLNFEQKTHPIEVRFKTFVN